MKNKDMLKENKNNEEEILDDLDNLTENDYEETLDDLKFKNKKVNKRIDFSTKNKRILASRVGFRCSNPECNLFTLGPATDSNKITLLGEVAHIVGAVIEEKDKTKSPRADSSKSPEYIKSLDNGIWLCPYCHKLVDSDPEYYTVNMLREWKIKAEKRQADALKELRNSFVEKYIFPNITDEDKGIDTSKFKEKDWSLLIFVITLFLNKYSWGNPNELNFDNSEEVCFQRAYPTWLSENNIEIKKSGLCFNNDGTIDFRNLGIIIDHLTGLVVLDSLNGCIKYGDELENFVYELKKSDKNSIEKIISKLAKV